MPATRTTPPIAVSLGDPAGIGPEIIAEAWTMISAVRRGGAHLPPFYVAGGAQVLAGAVASRGLNVPLIAISHPQAAAAAFVNGLPVLGALDGAYTPGVPSRGGAALALASLTQAVRAVVAGAASALVTAPIAKARLAEVGFAHPGQTEFVAEACGIAAQDAVMMLAGPHLRSVPLTVHVALAAVPGLITQGLILRRARIIAAALRRDFGIPSPRIAVAALNPHAGEDGRMGQEDAAVIAPAIAALRAEGIDASGPHPADALFTPRARATYDVALCMYHDQALIPIKALDFDEGVNVTLGLPVVRTSPDHGTAFAIAGKKLADPGALCAALRMAGECAARRAAVR